jgi:hypothetical protein
VRWTVVVGLQGHPWVVTTAVVWWLVGLAGWLVLPHRSIWPLAFWCGLGLLVAVTLTPSLNGPPRWVEPGTCLPQWPRTGFGLWAPDPQRRWNVLLGVPLGLTALAWPLHDLAHGRRRSRAWWAPPAALVVPALVEAGQARLPALRRSCAVVDVVDNVSGVLLGFLAVVAVAVPLLLLLAGRRAVARRSDDGSR